MISVVFLSFVVQVDSSFWFDTIMLLFCPTEWNLLYESWKRALKANIVAHHGIL